MTETAQMADVVLPACTFLEDTYYATYDAGAYLKPTHPGLLMLRPQVVPPLAESRPDWQIIFDLARRMGCGEYFPWDSIEDAIDYELEPTGITVRDLRASPGGIRIPAPPFLYPKFGNKGLVGRLMIRLLSRTKFREYPCMYQKYERNGFMTPSGKVELMSGQLQEMGYDPLPIYREEMAGSRGEVASGGEYPLVLTTGAKAGCYVHSQQRNIPALHRLMRENLAEMHPHTAAGAGVADGDMTAIASPYGSLRCKARVTTDIVPRVVQLYHGFNESNANLLTDDGTLDPITGAAPVRSGVCRIEAA